MPDFVAARIKGDFVLVPTKHGAAGDVEPTAGSDSRIEIIARDDAADLFGRIAPTGPDLTPVATPPPRVARLYTERGETLLSAAQADALRERSHEFDLFIDGVHPRFKRGISGYAASVRRADKTHRDAFLNDTAVSLLTTLVARRVPMRAKEVARDQPNAENAAKAVERARRVLEEKPWQWFLTRRGLIPELKTYVFSPPPGASFAVLVPLAHEAPPTRKEAA